MSEIPDLPDIVELAVPFFILSMVAELLVGLWRGTARYETRDTLTSLVMGAGSLVEAVAFDGRDDIGSGLLELG